MGIKLAQGYCVQCDDAILKSIIGKREKALCINHYNAHTRSKAKPIANKSDTRTEEDKIYFPVRKVFLKDNPNCICGQDGCSKKATEIHHTKGHGLYYLDVETWVPLCESCHRNAEVNPDWAKALFLSQDRLTPFKIMLPFNLKLENSIDKLYSLTAA